MWWLILDKTKSKYIFMQPKVVGDSNHAIHRIYLDEIEKQDQGDENEQMGGDDEEA